MVTCIMPTRNRRRFIPASINLFLAQSHREKELIILDDDDAEVISDLVPHDLRIRYFREPRRSLGDKHNRMVELAQGEYIAHWGDDDYHAPWRLAYQVRLLKDGADMTSPTDILRIDARNQIAWHERTKRLSGGALAYRRSIWERYHYDDVAVGEDGNFIDGQLRNDAKVSPHSSYSFHVHRIHADNSCMGKIMLPAEEAQVPFEEVKAVIGDDWDKYFGAEGGLPR
jgi:glycosyltransferase involved in cell wall biosynthesis